MKSVLLLLLLFSSICLADNELITCQGDDDYYHFLYKLCYQSLACKHLYHLYPLSPGDATSLSETPERDAFVDYRNERDFKLFRQQLTARSIFHVQSKGPIRQTTTTMRTVLKGTIPDDWIPSVTVLIKPYATVSCSENVSQHTELTRMTALYAMHIYKLTVSDEFFCHDPNERLLIDPLTNETICLCKRGKACNNDSTFDELFTFLLVILIFGIVAFIFTAFVVLFYKRSMLYDLWGNQK